MPMYTGSSSTATTATWDVWITSGTSTTCTATTNTIWTGWATSTASSAVYVSPHRHYEPTAADLAAQAAREAEWKKSADERAAAETKAEELLLASVSPRQASQYRRLKWFTVQGASGAMYRVRKGRVGNVDRVTADGVVVQRFCAHPAESVPDCDTMLAQALMLEVDDLHFCNLANRHGTNGDRVPVAELRH